MHKRIITSALSAVVLAATGAWASGNIKPGFKEPAPPQAGTSFPGAAIELTAAGSDLQTNGVRAEAEIHAWTACAKAYPGYYCATQSTYNCQPATGYECKDENSVDSCKPFGSSAGIEALGTQLCIAKATAKPLKMGYPSYSYTAQNNIDTFGYISDSWAVANDLEALGAQWMVGNSALSTCLATHNTYCVLPRPASGTIGRCEAKGTKAWRCPVSVTAYGWTYYSSPAEMNPQAPTPPSRKPGQSRDGQ